MKYVLFMLLVCAVSARAQSTCAVLSKLDIAVGSQDVPSAIQDLQTRVKKLESCLDQMQLDASILDPRAVAHQVDYNTKKLTALEDRLLDTEARLVKAERTIQLLDLRILALESRKRTK